MNGKAVRTAQKYLTYYKNDVRKRIVDIQRLSRDHTVKEIADFLKDYLREKEKGLRNMILIDRTHRKVDEMVAVIFRLYMAIGTLEEGRDLLHFAREAENRTKTMIKPGKEVSRIDTVEQGAGTGGQFYRGDGGGDCRARKRKDENHDGADRHPGHETRRAA